MKRIFSWKIVHIVVIILVLGFLFYWFQFRPYQIRKACYTEANDTMKGLTEVELPKLADSEVNTFVKNMFGFYYQACLYEHGLKE